MSDPVRGEFDGNSLAPTVSKKETLLRRRRVVFAALGAGVTALQSNALGQSAAQRAPVITPAPSAPEGDWRSKEAAEAERKRLEKIRLEDERLAKLPRNQRVLRPKSVEINGKKYVELDMYGTRFRIPIDYLGAYADQAADVHIFWPTKTAVKDTVAQNYFLSLLPSTNAVTAETQAEIDRRASYRMELWLRAPQTTRFEGERKMSDYRRQGQSIHASIFGKGKEIAAIGANATEFFYNDYYIRRNAADLHSPSGDVIWLSRRSLSNSDRHNEVFQTTFPYRGIFIWYFISRRLVPEWKEIHTEILRLLDQWTKE